MREPTYVALVIGLILVAHFAGVVLLHLRRPSRLFWVVASVSGAALLLPWCRYLYDAGVLTWLYGDDFRDFYRGYYRHGVALGVVAGLLYLIVHTLYLYCYLHARCHPGTTLDERCLQIAQRFARAAWRPLGSRWFQYGAPTVLILAYAVGFAWVRWNHRRRFVKPEANHEVARLVRERYAHLLEAQEQDPYVDAILSDPDINAIWDATDSYESITDLRYQPSWLIWLFWLPGKTEELLGGNRYVYVDPLLPEAGRGGGNGL